MAGYSGTPLLRKVGVKDEHLVLLDRAPDGFELGETSARVVRRLPTSGLDVTLTFQTRLSDLEARLPTLFDRTVTAGMVWVTGTDTGYAPPPALVAAAFRRSRLASRTAFCSVSSAAACASSLSSGTASGVVLMRFLRRWGYSGQAGTPLKCG